MQGPNGLIKSNPKLRSPFQAQRADERTQHASPGKASPSSQLAAGQSGAEQLSPKMAILTGLKTQNELETLSKLAATEMRIYKLYADLSQNQLKKQKLGAMTSIKRAQGDIEEWNQQIEVLSQENYYLKQVLNRYKKMILNFETEYAALKVRGRPRSRASLQAAAADQLNIVGSPD